MSFSTPRQRLFLAFLLGLTVLLSTSPGYASPASVEADQLMITGRLLDASGQPMLGNYAGPLDIVGTHGDVQADGRFTFFVEPGTTRLQVGTQGDVPSFHYRLVTENITFASNRNLGDLRLPPFRPLHLRVVDQDGTPVPNAAVLGHEPLTADNDWSAVGTALAPGVIVAATGSDYSLDFSRRHTDTQGSIDFPYPTFDGNVLKEWIRVDFSQDGINYSVPINRSTQLSTDSYELTIPFLQVNTPPPIAPSGVTATRGDKSAVVSWTAADGNGSPIQSYAVTSSPGGITKTVTGTQTSTTVTGLTNGTPYTFTVIATNAHGDSPPSTASNSVTPIGLPSAPRNVAAIRGDASALVTWAAPADDGGDPLLGYQVQATPGGSSTIIGPDEGSATIRGLRNGISYTFAVRTANQLGVSPYGLSNAVTPAGKPGRVNKPTARVQGMRIVLRWNAPDSNGEPVTRYKVRAEGVPDATTNARTRRAAFTVRRPGRYEFRVVAVNALGSSRPSRVITVRVRP